MFCLLYSLKQKIVKFQYIDIEKKFNNIDYIKLYANEKM